MVGITRSKVILHFCPLRQSAVNVGAVAPAIGISPGNYVAISQDSSERC